MVFMPHWPHPLGSKRIDLGLERVKKLLEALGNPHHKIKNVIHVAGTNGKGSTIAFLRYILSRSGLSVNSYISPHLMRFNERILLNQEEISDDFLFEVCEEVRLAAEKAEIEPTFFEGTTVVAICAFAKRPADYLILETGMGGRLDATNIFDKPLLTIITTIGLDHQNFLGDTVAQIAYEKAGILKEGVPCIVANQEPDSFAVISHVAQKLNCPILACEYDWLVDLDEFGSLEYKNREISLDKLEPGLLGVHQYVNLGNAICAALMLNNPKITYETIRRGVADTRWMGRLQKLLDGTLVTELGKKHQIWVDGAHNLLGTHILSLWIEEQNLPIYMIVGITNGRDIEAIMSPFIDKVKFVAGCNVHSEPNSYSGIEVSERVGKMGFNSLGFDNSRDALVYIFNNFAPGIIIACGSLYLAGELLLENQYRRQN